MSRNYNLAGIRFGDAKWYEHVAGDKLVELDSNGLPASRLAVSSSAEHHDEVVPRGGKVGCNHWSQKVNAWIVACSSLGGASKSINDVWADIN